MLVLVLEEGEEEEEDKAGGGSQDCRCVEGEEVAEEEGEEMNEGGARSQVTMGGGGLSEVSTKEDWRKDIARGEKDKKIVEVRERKERGWADGGEKKKGGRGPRGERATVEAEGRGRGMGGGLRGGGREGEQKKGRGVSLVPVSVPPLFVS